MHLENSCLSMKLLCGKARRVGNTLKVGLFYVTSDCSYTFADSSKVPNGDKNVEHYKFAICNYSVSYMYNKIVRPSTDVYCLLAAIIHAI